jgi:transcriptional regulator with XRE-family HTH domain
MKLGDNLRELRHKQKISQEEFADFLGVDRKTYSRWEEGKVGVNSDYLPKIAEFLQVKIDDLFKGKPGDIVINQHNSDNKDSLIGGVMLFLTDKEMLTQIFEVINKRVEKQ